MCWLIATLVTGLFGTLMLCLSNLRSWSVCLKVTLMAYQKIILMFPFKKLLLNLSFHADWFNHNICMKTTFLHVCIADELWYYLSWLCIIITLSEIKFLIWSCLFFIRPCTRLSSVFAINSHILHQHLNAHVLTICGLLFASYFKSIVTEVTLVHGTWIFYS